MRILIADDSELIRRGIAILLASEKNWEICGEASDGVQTLHKARELKPDLVLLDVSMPGVSGLATSQQIRRELPATRILIITHHDAEKMLPSALEAGADGCIDKGRLALDLISAIRKLDPRNVRDSGSIQ
jgi:two-component system, NarL family, response regulator NreC